MCKTPLPSVSFIFSPLKYDFIASLNFISSASFSKISSVSSFILFLEKSKSKFPNFIEKFLAKEIKSNVVKFLFKENIKNIKEIKILNLWVVRQFKGEYNPIHYHEGDLSGVGYLMLPKKMTDNKMVKNKKLKTNGTIDFINGQKGFLSKSIYNVVPKVKDLLIFPNYLLHTVYPFRGTDEERRSISFNAYIDEKIHNVYSG